jgi:hypothetical protein
MSNTAHVVDGEASESDSEIEVAKSPVSNYILLFFLLIHNTYMPLTHSPSRGSRGISDIPPRLRFLQKILRYEEILYT